VIYEYRCPKCRALTTSTHRGDRLHEPCGACGHSPLHRKFSVAVKPMMHEHFNKAVGKPISSMRQFKDELKAASEKATEETGIPHNYVPVEYGDREAFGATGEGIYERNVRRSKVGLPPLPTNDSV